MEFYVFVTCASSFVWLSFNSQRDGILLEQIKAYCLEARFQFPTGWNSTVSFADEAINRAGFNSQRDGILL